MKVDNKQSSSKLALSNIGMIRPVDFSTGSKVVIRVENLSKRYNIGTINHRTLAYDLQSLWARLCGKEDPNVRFDVDGSGPKSFWALKDVSFDIKQGETFGVIGKNGAGKSTLLKLLSQITTPTRGAIKIKGRVASLLEVGTGFHPELTGRENVFLNGAILGMNKHEISSKFDEIVAFSEIEKFIDTPVKRYSSGMYVRLAFAVAAHLEPEILIVDEVLAVGDADFQRKCLGKMEEIGGEGRTVLFVSHNMSSIKALCQNGIMLQNGLLQKAGLIDDVLRSYLNDEDSLSPSVIFEEDAVRDIQICEVSVVNCSGELAGHHPYDQPFFLRIKIKVNKRVAGVYLASHILDKDLQTVLFSRNFTPANDGGNVMNPGTYVYSIEYPAPLFTPDKYRVCVHAALLSPAEILDGVENVCRFELYDSGSINAQKGFPWRGRLSVPVKWDIL